MSIYTSLEIDLLCNVRFKLVNLHTLLLHAVTVADGNAAVIFTVKVIRDAERRADLILAAIALADGTRIVKVNRKLLCERIVNLAGLFAQLLGERQNRCLKRCQCRVQTQYNAHIRFFFGAEVFFVVSVAQERQRYAVRAERRLDDIRHIAGVRLRIEIGEILAGMLLMAGEVIVRAVCNAPKLAPAEREQILNIRRRLGVEGELLLAVVAQADVRFVQTEV